jgi:hypothetical protein
MLPVSNLPSRLLLIVDDLERGELLARHLTAEGHEVRWARDTMEARWVWMRNYFDSVIVCARGAHGFVERIKKESPQQNISVVSPEELAVWKKPPARVVPFQKAYQRKNNILEMPRSCDKGAQRK